MNDESIRSSAHATTQVKPSANDLRRFLDKLDKHGPTPKDKPQLGPCWVWRAATQRGGYGCMVFNGKVVPAHILSWRFFRGEIPRGLCVLHQCDNPPCVNPDHLFIGTHGDNARDKISKGRQNKGEKNGGNKLSESQMQEIRLRRESGETLASIAADYKITFQHVSAIAKRIKWRHYA